jgi:hypothetical protein
MSLRKRYWDEEILWELIHSITVPIQFIEAHGIQFAFRRF